jgi:hypothetical protein
MDDMELMTGSKCVIYSMGSEKETLVTRGTFVGNTYIGKDEGICIKMDSSHREMKGKMRIIPVSMVISIDILEKKRNRKHDEENLSHYYG